MSTVLKSATLPRITLIHAVEQTFTVRYILFAAYTGLLVEHLAFVPEEIEVWKSSWNLAKVFFLLYRYSAIAGLTMVMHVASGITDSLDTTICKHIVASMVAMSTLSMAIADAMVMLRVSVLWGRRRAILILLFLSFVVSCTVVIVCAALVATEFVASTIIISGPGLNICVPIAKPSIILGLWIPGMTFDVLVLTLTGWNAFSRPRAQSTAMTQTLYRDGIMFFLILAGLRFANFMIALLSRQYVVGVCVAWPISAITLSRFVFHVRSVEQSQSPDSSPVPSMSGCIPDDDARLSHLPRLPRGSSLQMQRWGGIEIHSQTGSTAVGSDLSA